MGGADLPPQLPLSIFAAHHPAPTYSSSAILGASRRNTHTARMQITT